MGKAVDAQPYTEAQYEEFCRLVEDHSSRDQVERIRGRLGLRELQKQLTKEVCDLMWERNQREYDAKYSKKGK